MNKSQIQTQRELIKVRNEMLSILTEQQANDFILKLSKALGKRLKNGL